MGAPDKIQFSKTVRSSSSIPVLFMKGISVVSTARALIRADHCLISVIESNLTPPGAVTKTSSVGFDEWHELHLI